MRPHASWAHFSHAVATESCRSIFFEACCALLKKGVDMWKLIVAFAATLIAGNAYAETSWTYDGQDNDQSLWATLSDDFKDCGGGNQSPLIIKNTEVRNIAPLTFDYPKSPAHLTRNFYSIVTTPDDTLTLKEGARKSTLKHMLIRTPSEHQVGDSFYPLELQFMHEDKNKKRTNLAVFVMSGKENAGLKSIADSLTKHEPTLKVDMDWGALLPPKHGYYAYSGSQSYPPCTEGMDVRVMKMPIEASKDQIEAIIRKLGRNSRTLQDLNFRTITESVE